MSPSPTLVLDLDGTLVDTAPDLVTTLNVILTSEGLPPLDFATARKFVGYGARVMINAGFRACGAIPEDEQLDRLFLVYLAHYSDHIADYSEPFPGVAESLDRFSKAGWTLAVCTNKQETPAKLLLTRLGLADRFAFIAGHDTFGTPKPDPRALLRTLAEAGGDPAAAIMVGDSDVDIATGRAAGVPVVGVSFGYSQTPIADLGPDAAIDHFDQLFDAANRLVGHKPQSDVAGAGFGSTVA